MPERLRNPIAAAYGIRSGGVKSQFRPRAAALAAAAGRRAQVGARRGVAHAKKGIPMMRSLMVVAVALALLFTGCASNQAAAGPPGNAASAGASGGCEIDAMKICEAVREQPVTQGGTGLTEDARSRQQNGPATAWQTSWFPVANGHVLQVQCLINTQHSTVVHATVLKGPELNEADYNFLRGHALCKE